MNSGQTNMELMKTLDDGWNSQDWDTFEECHTNIRYNVMINTSFCPLIARWKEMIITKEKYQPQ
jgi:hypothetical protein